ncbi:MAG: hypothetical protein NTV44_06325 [Firmicutes bacterium]|nr:hypothetical protein [Bacillota bacterium]
MKKIITIVVGIIALLNITLLTVLFISFGWTFAFTVLGYASASAAALLGISYGVYRWSKKKWLYAYLPSFIVLVLAMLSEIVMSLFNLFPGLSGLVPTMVILVGLTGSVISLIVVHILVLIKTKQKVGI